jgi:hypothetical protein
MDLIQQFWQALNAPLGGVETVHADGGASFLIMMVVMVISMVLSMVLAPKPPRPPDAELQKQETPTNDPSKYVGVAFGRVRVKDPIIAWFGNTKQVPIMSDQGGKK